MFIYLMFGLVGKFEIFLRNYMFDEIFLKMFVYLNFIIDLQFYLLHEKYIIKMLFIN